VSGTRRPPPALFSPRTRARLLTALTGAGAARAGYAAAKARPPGGEHTWTRTNHRGEPVTLIEGPAVAAGAVAATVAAAGVPARARAAAALAGVGAAAFGAYDDLAGSGDRRGFRGHLGALRQGQLTTGAVKLGGIGVTGIGAAVALGGSPADVAINAGLVAGGANLLNLFDLRPGRAIKVALLATALLRLPVRATAGDTSAGAGIAAAAAGSAAGLLGEDLGERAMLGDAGANALGAVLGTAAAADLPRGARLAVLAAIAGLTAASEVVSFTKVIERTAPLRWLDMLGRRPPGPPRDPGPAEAADVPRTGAVPHEAGAAAAQVPAAAGNGSNGTAGAGANGPLQPHPSGQAADQAGHTWTPQSPTGA
jgi:UDP-GlcNAc:undecaprenyl-phosphate/decaprenyl-phosphate GlcNAc-1-phosphate transferase